MQDKTIDNTLLALRKQIIRTKGKGQEQIETLLAIRGVDMPGVLPAVPRNSARSNQMARWLLDALSQRPMTRRELVAYLTTRRPDVDRQVRYWRTDSTLSRLRQIGVVLKGTELNGRLWRLAR